MCLARTDDDSLRRGLGRRRNGGTWQMDGCWERKRPEGIQEVRKSSVLGLGDGIKVGSEARNGEES